MARATTWAEFIEKQDSEKRVVALCIGLDAGAPPATKLFTFSNIERNPISGLSVLIHKGIKSVPGLSYNTNEIGGNPPAPSWGNLVLYREDGYDISDDGSGIYFRDLGNSWILRDQFCFIYFGGDDLPWSEYRLIFSGRMGGISRNDMTLTIDCLGNENQAYRATMGNVKITSATWPNAAANWGKTIPCIVGFAWNTEPVVVDTRTAAPNNLRFAFHDNTRPYTGVSVYDAGVGLIPFPTPGFQYTDNGDGTFTLTTGYVPVGKITCSCTGPDAFVSWATQITNLLTTYAGIPVGQIDAAAVAAANAAMPWAMGYAVEQEMSVMDVVREMSQGVPAYYGFNRSGTFTMEEVTDPSAKTPDYIINSEISNAAPVAILNNTLAEKPANEVIDTCNAEYFENFAPLARDRLSGTLTETQKMLYYKSYRDDTYTDGAVVTLYPYATAKNILLRVLSVVSSQAAAVKWVDLLKTDREYTAIRIKSMELTYNIGDIVSVTFLTELDDGTPWYRHNYNDRRMMITGIREDYNNFETTLTLWG